MLPNDLIVTRDRAYFDSIDNNCLKIVSDCFNKDEQTEMVGDRGGGWVLDTVASWALMDRVQSGGQTKERSEWKRETMVDQSIAVGSFSSSWQ